MTPEERRAVKQSTFRLDPFLKRGINMVAADRGWTITRTLEFLLRSALEEHYPDMKMYSKKKPLS